VVCESSEGIRGRWEERVVLVNEEGRKLGRWGIEKAWEVGRSGFDRMERTRGVRSIKNGGGCRDRCGIRLDKERSEGEENE